MMWLLRRRATAIWLLLFSATGLSSWLGERTQVASRRGVIVVALAVMMIAVVKIRFVLIHFMELRRAPMVWRLIFEAWLLVLGLALVALYLRGAMAAPGAAASGL